MTERERRIMMGEDIEPRTADENAYANVSGGGGGGVTVATFTTGGPTDPATCDMTYEELVAALENGPVVGRLSKGSANYYCLLSDAVNSGISGVVSYKDIGESYAGYYVHVITYTEADGVSIIRKGVQWADL